jgi:RNA-binding protein PNO1
MSSSNNDVIIAPSALAQESKRVSSRIHTKETETNSSSSELMKPSFPAISAQVAGSGRDETRSIRVPAHRYTPLKENWENIVKPIVEHMRLQIRMNTKNRTVELKTSNYTTEVGALQKAEDFVKAFLLGFEFTDAVALLRLDDLYVESFEVTDVKPLKGGHLSRAIGRIAGINGKTKHAIENATRTRIVVADSKIHILGAFANIQVARDAVCSLILGSPPGKVYNQMRQVAARISQR